MWRQNQPKNGVLLKFKVKKKATSNIIQQFIISFPIEMAWFFFGGGISTSQNVKSLRSMKIIVNNERRIRLHKLRIRGRKNHDEPSPNHWPFGIKPIGDGFSQNHQPFGVNLIQSDPKISKESARTRNSWWLCSPIKDPTPGRLSVGFVEKSPPGRDSGTSWEGRGGPLSNHRIWI